MFEISKRKLIENYKKQLKEKDKEIKNLTEQNKRLLNLNKTLNEKKYRMYDKIQHLEFVNKILNEISDEMEKEIDNLVDKKIKRLEAIKSRTKKYKVKKKCDSRILEIEKRYL